MRLVPAFALMSSALALAACGGGGGGLTGGNTLSAAALRANVGSVCSVNDTNCIPGGTSGGGTTSPDPDNDGIAGDDDTDGSIGSGGGGNNTQLVVGQKSLALQKFAWTKPVDGETALAILTSPDYADEAAIETAILSAAAKPKSLTFAVDTNAKNNSEFSIPALQKEYVYGTRDLRWLFLGHSTVNPSVFQSAATTPFRDRNGNPVIYNLATMTLVYAANDPGGAYSANQTVDLADDFYWNQLTPFMSSKANGGDKDGYREYRVVSTADNRDEVLQVWSWDNSYTLGYQNQIGGGDPKQQVWTIGGNETTTMPVGGTATYAGRWVGTGKTSNWVKPDGADIDPNASWMMQGRSNFQADFTNSTITGTITPETWTSWQEKIKGRYTWWTNAATTVPATDPYAPAASIGTPVAPDYEFYDIPLNLKGTIVAGTTTTTTTAAGPVTTTVKNAFVGEGNFAGQYITGDNPFYGSFFGNNAGEVTGVFTATGKTLDPLGGSTGLLDARRATITINGSFNADCTTLGTCAPP
jgi:hypothetical protein